MTVAVNAAESHVTNLFIVSMLQPGVTLGIIGWRLR
jgi:hypothetical protein